MREAGIPGLKSETWGTQFRLAPKCDYWMTNVNVVVPLFVEVTESWPVSVIVYVPLEGSVNWLVELLLQADIAKPAAARTSIQAAERNLRA